MVDAARATAGGRRRLPEPLQRSVRQAMAFLQSGGIGEVYAARGLCFKAATRSARPRRLARATGSSTSSEQPGVNYDQAYMANVDYDAWLVRPPTAFNYNRFHYNCTALGLRRRRLRQPGTPSVGHRRWGSPGRASKKISSKGGFTGECAQETPNTRPRR